MAESNVRTVTGADMLDVWLSEDAELDIAWGEWRELTFDPDCDPWLG